MYARLRVHVHIPRMLSVPLCTVQSLAAGPGARACGVTHLEPGAGSEHGYADWGEGCAYLLSWASAEAEQNRLVKQE